MRGARMPRRALGLAAAVTLALTLAACFPARPSRTGLAQPDAVTPLPEITDPNIVAFCPPMVGAHLDGVVSPVDRVYVCRADVDLDTDGISTYGPWQIAYRIDHPEHLLAAYSVADAVARPSSECGARIVDPLIIWVDRGGAVSAYYAPVDGCGAPIPSAVNAYRTAARIAVADVDTGAPGYAPTPIPTPKEH
jgi:hypothetical protein